MLDVLIRGSFIVDGTGAVGRHADVGIRDGKLVLDPAGSAKRIVEADGLVLAPGFVDLHTHYDAQLFWDASANPSPQHGVTTVVAGNCGFTLAPSGPEHAEYLKRLIARVEGMPIAALNTVDFDWAGFGDYLSRLDGNIGVNAGVLVGHSALRRFVMGDASVSEPATAKQIEAMVALLHESLNAGGLGFSSSTASQHVDGDGAPVPSRSAERRELLALAGAVREHPGTAIAVILAGAVGGFSDDELDLMAEISLTAGRPVNWNTLRASVANADYHNRQLEASDRAEQRGACVRALITPQDLRIRLSFLTGFVLDAIPDWHDTIHLPRPELARALADPEVRRRLYEGSLREKPGGVMSQVVQWDRMYIGEVYSEANSGLEGRTVGSIAAERGSTPFDTLCDVVLADGLRTGLDPDVFSSTRADLELRADLWRDDRTIVGGSDAGAHLDAQCGAVWSTWLLGVGVREQKLISLEEAVRQLSDVPARLYGLRGRGRITDGWQADLVLFDPESVGPHPIRSYADLPGGATRLNAEADGVEHVWVNGSEIIEHGSYTGSRSGRLLRSGRDTDTVSVPGAR